MNAQPYQGKKKGADTGIDGLIYFQDDKGLPKKIVVSVKAGENIGVAMIRDFAHVIDREKATLGLFVTLAEPTRAMKEEAAALGFYESLGTTIFPKLQILPVKGLIEGTISARYPDLTRGGLTLTIGLVFDRFVPPHGYLQMSMIAIVGLLAVGLLISGLFVFRAIKPAGLAVPPLDQAVIDNLKGKNAAAINEALIGTLMESVVHNDELSEQKGTALKRAYWSIVITTCFLGLFGLISFIQKWHAG